MNFLLIIMLCFVIRWNNLGYFIDTVVKKFKVIIWSHICESSICTSLISHWVNALISGRQIILSDNFFLQNVLLDHIYDVVWSFVCFTYVNVYSQLLLYRINVFLNLSRGINVQEVLWLKRSRYDDMMMIIFWRPDYEDEVIIRLRLPW